MSTVTSYGDYPLDHYVYVPKDRVEKQNIKDGFKYDVPGVKFKIREAGRDWLVTAQTYFLMYVLQDNIHELFFKLVC